MRASSLLASLLGIKHLVVTGFDCRAGALVVAVRPSWKNPRCSRCGRPSKSAHDQRQNRLWRHLDFGGVRVELAYDLRRLACLRCRAVVVEAVPWAVDTEARFTKDFDEQVAFVAQRMDKTAVQKLFGIAWRTVGVIIERVVARLRKPLGEGGSLRAIGVDDLSYRKHHHYLTLVTDHFGRRVVWGHEGRDAESLMAFFDMLGEQKCKEIEVVTMDMSGAFIKAVRHKLPHAQIVFDRFHVQQLASDALDETRRDTWRSMKGTEAGDGLKQMRWVLLKNNADLSESEVARLSELETTNGDLYRGYLLKESLGAILGGKQINVMSGNLRDWIYDARMSGLSAFARTANTIEAHFDGIVAYAKWRFSNGLVEGMNNKARLLTRRGYGFHSAAAVLAAIELCCSGLVMNPIAKAVAGVRR